MTDTAEAGKEEEKKADGAEGAKVAGSDSEAESGEDERDPEVIKEELMTACRENNLEAVEVLLQEKGCEVVFEKEGWSPILWAACNGSEEIVRLLVKQGACAPYMNQSKALDQGADNKSSDDYDPFVKQPDPKKFGKYTPLHWASYKGFYKVTWILLKQGMSPLDVDQYGNTAVHQAAASKSIDVLKCFLS